MSLQTFAEYPRIVYNTRKSVELGKLASILSHPESTSALAEKAAVDNNLVSDLEKVGSRLLKSLKLLKSEELGKLLAVGGVGALGAGAGAAYAGSRAEEGAKKQLNKALLAALGVGAAAYGMGRKAGSGEKEASDNSATFEKIAAAAEVALKTREALETLPSEELRKYASEVLITANAHVADLVSKVILD